jgi:hypothetical protein
VRLASNSERLHGAGAELVAISVDDEVRQAGMARRWGLTHTRMVADPGGERYLRPLGLFDPEDRGGIALPAMVAVASDGTEVYRYQGRDFADRTNDDDLYEALEALGLPPVDPAPWEPQVDVPDDLRGFFRPEDFAAYFRGNLFGAQAIAGRLDDPAAKAIALQHRDMSKATVDAWQKWQTRPG